MKITKPKEPSDCGPVRRRQLSAEELKTLRFNPFAQLHELTHHDEIGIGEAERDLYVLRQAAAQMDGRRIAIFAMPKSGSSFVRSVIARTAQLPTVTLTSIPADGGNVASYLGINGREQEIDELALILQTHRNSGSWVAHHHTRFTPYLARQLAFFKITPMVVVRNILDAIVSMDDMIMSARRSGGWAIDTPHALPLDYPELDRDSRLVLLSRDFGIWLIKFLVSWKRAIEAHFTFPLIISYEEDILNLPVLGSRLSDLLDFDEQQRAALFDYFKVPPGKEAMFNKGVAGRGTSIPGEARELLANYARQFRADLGDDGIRYLFGSASDL